MALSVAQIQTAYVAFFNRPADPAGLQFWAEEHTGDYLALLEAFSQQPEYASLMENLSNEEAITTLYDNLFGREPDTEGFAYWLGELESGAVTRAFLADALVQGAQAEDAVILENKATAAASFTSSLDTPAKVDAYADPATVNIVKSWLAGVDESEASLANAQNNIDGLLGSLVPVGDATQLTAGQDNLVGTAGNDQFVSFIFDNQNTLQSGDMINGGAGRDQLHAELGSSADFAITPKTQSVEEVYIRAQSNDFDDDADNTIGGGVQVDAQDMVGVKEWWSVESRAHLTIEDIRLNNSEFGQLVDPNAVGNSLPRDVTFGLRSTDSDVDFNAYFDSQSLIAAPSTVANSQLLIQIADVSTETPDTPLANVNLSLSFQLGGETVSIANVRSTDGSYAGLQQAIDAALAAEGYASLRVELTTPYNEVTVAGNTVVLPFVAQEILVTDPSGNAFSNVSFTQSAIEPVAGGFLVAGTAEPSDPAVRSNLIETNVALDNAGRGSLGGDVEIGGMSNSGGGIQKFNVTVDRDSAISGLYTTNNRLQVIDIASEGANGSLFLGNTQGGLREIDANAFEGAALSLGEAGSIQNLAFLDAAGTSADVTFVGANTNGLAASIQTGAGDDVIELYQDGVSGSGSTPTSVTINAGNGDNVVVLSSDNFDGIDNTAIVTTGNGADIITGGANSLTVNSGAGNDVIYAENTGLKTTAVLDAGVFAGLVGTTAVNGSTVQEAQLLHGRQALVTLGLPGMNPADAYAEGLEVLVDIKASNGHLTTERDLYQAVADGINGDPVLSALATASVDSNGHLTVTYKIDGVTNATDDLVKIEVQGVWNDLSSAVQNSIVAELKAAYSNSTIAAAGVGTAYDNAAAGIVYAEVDTAGSDSLTTGGTNVVTAGQGDDVVVLSSDATLVDTLVFEAGQFGNDTIVHFDANDLLDFTAWLNNVESASGSVDSQVRIASNLETGTGVGANEVVVTTSASVGVTSAAEFASLNGATMLAELNAAGGFTVTAAVADFVGNTQRSIFMVENVFNEGEYKVFQVSSTDQAGENFTAVTLVGSLDFGATLAAPLLV